MNIYNNKSQCQQHVRYPFERFASVTSYIGFDFLTTDPSWMIYIADTNGQFNLWRQRSTLSSEREPYASYRLTNFIDEAVRHIFPSPVDNNIIFFADHQGTENFQIYKIDDVFHSWPESITQNTKVRHEWGSECFSHDGKYIVYGSNEENPSNMLVHVRNMNSSTSNETYCITNKDGWYVPGYWSPDNKKLNCSQLTTLTDYDIWLLDIENNEMVQITPLKGMAEKSRFTVGPWSLDGKGFYVISDLQREYASLAFYDTDKSELQWILTPEHDIELVYLSSDGTTLAWTENVDGYSSIFTKDLRNGKVEEITNLSLNGVIEDLKLSANGKRLGIMMTTPITPSDIYVIDIGENKDYNNNNNIQKITRSLLGNIPENLLIRPDLIRYKSFDGLEISAFLYKPKEEIVNNKPQKFGAILSVHGGPTAQEKPLYDYSGLYQYLANNKLAIIAPNFRGSKGYGKSFEKKIYHDWGGNELKDLEYAVKWLISQKEIDPNRIGVFGASFGGFAALSCITRLPQYNWKAAVDIVGPSNLVTFAKAVPEHWKRFMGELVGDPEKEESFLKERSPITYVDNINPTTNVLVIQGANDPRVVMNESDQIVERLRSKSIDIEYMVFEDEGHGFTKYSNLVRALKRSAGFLVKKLS
ncbi:MAG: prolyl oligopeptidase family serine peptidase [Candidatus Nitrosopolaris sp.]